MEGGDNLCGTWDAGAMLASGSADGVVKVWDASSGRLNLSVRAIPPAERTPEQGAIVRGVAGLAFSPCGSMLLVVGQDSILRDWVHSEAIVKVAVSRVHSEAIVKVAASRCGTMLLTVGDDGRALLLSSPAPPWTLATGLSGDASGPPQLRRLLLGSRGGVSAAAFSPDSRFLAIPDQQLERVTAAAFSPDSRFLAISDEYQV
ncbi:quinon protein alcohol dehydrogenase-like superfamily [Baffinella frigidus]|nr:quinon protein alcohol dehydrogenase-like superfamily [Cryptophyta sp. CCMP2293]